PAWSTSESTALVPPSQQLLAQARRAKRPSAEPTAFTPPPVQLLDELRSTPAAPEWGDADESIATAKRPRPSVPDDHDRETAVARLADIVERAAMTRRPPGERAVPRGAASERAVTVPRGDQSERAVTVPRGRPSELEVTHPRAAPVRDSDPGAERETPPFVR